MDTEKSDVAANPPLRIALVGYGRMGHEVERLASAQGVLVVGRYDVDQPLGDASTADFDVAIEFTHPDAVVDNIHMLLERSVPIVVGTTGWSHRVEEVVRTVTSHSGRLIYASNFSVGVLAFTRIVREAARLFERLEQYDVSVHETHHIGKADSPSGTALSLADEILQRISRKTLLLTETAHGRIAPENLHVTSQRLGRVVGTHSVTFDSEADAIELVHRAKNRAGLALGALLAARWIVSQPPGVYRFEEIF